MLLSPASQARNAALLLVLVFTAPAAFPMFNLLRSEIAAASAATPKFARALRDAVGSRSTPLGNTITVNSTSDVSDGTDGLCTLREAITAANTNTASGLVAGECAAGSGSGSDTINFSVNGTINLTGALPDISSDLTINGPGSGLLTVRRNTG